MYDWSVLEGCAKTCRFGGIDLLNIPDFIEIVIKIDRNNQAGACTKSRRNAVYPFFSKKPAIKYDPVHTNQLSLI